MADSTTTEPKPGDEFHFDNGGRIDIHMVEDGWVYYATYHPNDERGDAMLWRKRMPDWHISLAATKEKIVPCPPHSMPSNSTMAHTPGPWIWRWKSGSLHQAGTDRKYGATILAATYDYDEGLGITISDADDRLIVAAPDLLALLVESQETTGDDWCKRRDALIAHIKGHTP